MLFSAAIDVIQVQEVQPLLITAGALTAIGLNDFEFEPPPMSLVGSLGDHGL